MIAQDGWGTPRGVAWRIQAELTKLGVRVLESYATPSLTTRRLTTLINDEPQEAPSRAIP